MLHVWFNNIYFIYLEKNMEIGGGYDAYGSLVKNNVEEMHVVYNDADVAIFFLVPNSSCHPSQIMLLAAGIDFL
jgi:hypothetical protein